jgi:N-acetylglutamate synthase-like GNAT family acetyltransferase
MEHNSSGNATAPQGICARLRNGDDFPFGKDIFVDTTKTGDRNLHIRHAEVPDHPRIRELLGRLELSYPALDLASFWVGEIGIEVVAIAELKDLRACSLLSCVGVDESLQGSGIGKTLVEEVVRHAQHDIYLYTLVPGFFKKAGFSEAVILPPDLPPRSWYGCLGCDPSRCICLVRPRHDS